MKANTVPRQMQFEWKDGKRKNKKNRQREEDASRLHLNGGHRASIVRQRWWRTLLLLLLLSIRLTYLRKKGNRNAWKANK